MLLSLNLSVSLCGQPWCWKSVDINTRALVTQGLGYVSGPALVVQLISKCKCTGKPCCVCVVVVVVLRGSAFIIVFISHRAAKNLELIREMYIFSHTSAGLEMHKPQNQFFIMIYLWGITRQV